MKPLNLFLIAGLALATSLPAMAQTPPKTDEPVLSGPKVKEDGVPGEQRQFSPGRSKGKDMMGGEIPHRNFMRAVESLKTSEDMAVRLTTEQQSQIREINEGFVATTAEYRAEHRDEVRELLTKLTPEDRRRAQEFLNRSGENRRPELDKRKNVPKKGGEDGSMEAKTDPKTGEQARERMKELLAGAPNPADTHAKIHAVLTDAQKQAFKGELQKVREEMEARRKPEGKDAPKAPAKDGKEAKDGKGPKNIDINDPRIPEKARERLKNMSPEEREEAIKRFQERGKRKKD